MTEPAGILASSLCCLTLTFAAPAATASVVAPPAPVHPVAAPFPTTTSRAQKPRAASLTKDVLYEELAARWLEREGASPERLREEGMEKLLTERLLRVRLGAFDVYLPTGAFAEGKRAKTTARALAALAASQLQWSRWFPETRNGAFEEAGEDLVAWLEDLTAGDFAEPETLRGKELFADHPGAQGVREAAKLFETVMLAGGPLALEQGVAPAPLVLMPTRTDFVEFLCAVGQSKSYLRPHFWVESIVDWTAFDFDGTRVVALEFATARAREDYTQGIAMDFKNPKALTAQVVQLGARSLFECTFGERMEPMLAAGLANELVIDLYGEVDTRSDGDIRSREASARSVFIPGGNPNGGTLPANNADSRWRESKGKDHFVRVLKTAQKQGGKKAKERWAKLASFTVMSDDQSQKHQVVAPFLGPTSAAAPPPAFLADQAEFLRAYRAGFLYWLRVHAEGKKNSAARFARLLTTLATPGDAADLATLLEETYGRPLSSADGSELFEQDTLEGDFLLWLSKQ